MKWKIVIKKMSSEIIGPQQDYISQINAYKAEEGNKNISVSMLPAYNLH